MNEQMNEQMGLPTGPNPSKPAVSCKELMHAVGILRKAGLLLDGELMSAVERTYEEIDQYEKARFQEIVQGQTNVMAAYWRGQPVGVGTKKERQEKMSKMQQLEALLASI